MKRFLQILFTAAALALQILTKAAVKVTETGDNGVIYELVSYFNVKLFFSGMLPPLITGVLTCFLMILSIVAIKGKSARLALSILAPITFIVSLLPLVYKGEYRHYGALGSLSLLGACISLALLLSSVFAIWAMVRKKPVRAAPPPPPPPPPPPGDPA